MNPEATWIDPEEQAYNRTLRNSERYGRVMCADGIVRTCKLGIADTYFSIPAQLDAFGKRVAGFVANQGINGLDSDEQRYFRFTATGKHKDIFAPKETSA